METTTVKDGKYGSSEEDKESYDDSDDEKELGGTKDDGENGNRMQRLKNKLELEEIYDEVSE